MDATTADAVVVGAGHNGLVAANLLADAGWDVLVLEATAAPGGAVASAEVTAPGFVTDLYSAFYPFAAASPALQSLRLEEHGLSWSRAPSVLTHLLPDGRSATLWQDPARTAAELGGGDGEAWLRLTAEWDRIGDQVMAALLSPFPPVRPALGMLRRLGVAGAVRLARLGLLSVRRFGEENFTEPGGAALFAGNALHSDVPPDSAGTALFGWLLTMVGHTHGFPVPVGGAGALIDALVRRLDTAGGRLRLQARVRSIEIEDGRAVGVVLDSGERVRARRAVLADIVAPTLFTDLVGAEHLPARFVADLRRFQWDTPTLKIDWALRHPVPWTVAEARHSGCVHLGADLNGLTDYAADLATGRVPAQPFVLFGQMTTSDPTRSPAGTESAWAYTHLPRGHVPTAAEIRAHVDRVDATIERHAPGFLDSVIARFVQSPRELEDSDANLVGGAINGGTAQLHQQLVFRPVPGLGNAVTPIDRLYLAGSSAHPGGGVHGACGANAARAALARARAGGAIRHALQRAVLGRIYAADDVVVGASR